MAIPDLLRGCPLFRELYDKEMHKVVKRCSVYSFEPEEHIVRDGAEGDEIFVLIEGEAVVQKRTSQGVINIHTLQRGDVFGEMVLVDQRIRSADIVAAGVCHILEIKYDDIFQMFKKEPRIFGVIILNMSKLLAQRLRNSTDRIRELQDHVAHGKKAA